MVYDVTEEKISLIQNFDTYDLGQFKNLLAFKLKLFKT